MESKLHDNATIICPEGTSELFMSLIKMFYSQFRFLLLLLITLLLLFTTTEKLIAAPEANDPGLRIITEQYPPFNFSEKNKIKGIVTEIVEEILLRLELTVPIEIMPWARGYSYALEKPGTCLFSTTKTPERTPLFKWVGPVATTKVVLVTLKTNTLVSIGSLEDLNQYKVGVIRSDIGEQLLINSGRINQNILEPVSETLSNLKKLKSGRIDIIAYGEAPLKFEIKNNGYDINDFTTLYSFLVGDLYLAFHRETSDRVIDSFQKTLHEMKKDGIVQKIHNKYLNQ